MRSDSAFLKRFETGFAFLLVLAGFFSALHGVNDLGSTMDEGHFLNCGLKFLTTGDFHHGTDHPPFSMWFGALAPWIKGHLTPDTIGIQLARIPHVILYGLVGFVGTLFSHYAPANPGLHYFLRALGFEPWFKGGRFTPYDGW